MSESSKREPLPLSFAVLLGYLCQAIEPIADPRQPSNATCYNLADVVLGAFSVFFMPCESFLDHQRHLQSRQGKNNAQSLFGLRAMPSAAQIRNLLDAVAAADLFEVFFKVYEGLQRRGRLQAYQQWHGHLLVALDGTAYFQSQKLHCECCSSRTHKNGSVTSCHQAILPVIVAPLQTQVIALPHECITPQDVHQKQACEVAAAKRWMSTHRGRLQPQPITLLGDDLYSHQPMGEHCLQPQCSFIFTCLPESHAALYDWLDYLERHGEVQTLEREQWHKRTKELYRYRDVNQIPLRDTQPSLRVNWCEVTVVRESDGKVLYANAFITDHNLTAETVPPVVSAGRSRWKTENENHNVLKTKGYHLEHNFGHGQQHLAASLLTLNLLAFLFHTVLHLVDDAYQQIRHKRGTRKGFFQDILALTQYLWFESWQHLLDFMLSGSPPAQTANSP